MAHAPPPPLASCLRCRCVVRIRTHAHLKAPIVSSLRMSERRLAERSLGFAATDFDAYPGWKHGVYPCSQALSLGLGQHKD